MDLIRVSVCTCNPAAASDLLASLGIIRESIIDSLQYSANSDLDLLGRRIQAASFGCSRQVLGS